jgi:hypothetical protein
MTCERRQFRRSSWKGNPPKADVSSSTINKPSKYESNQEQQDVETQVVSELSIDPSHQAWPLYTSSNETETALNIGISAVTVPALASWTTQPGTVDVPLASMLHQEGDIQSVKFEQSNGFSISFSTGCNGAIPPNTPIGLYENVHFDTAIREGYFDNALMDAHLFSDSSERWLSDLDWSLVQQELPSLAHMPTELVTTRNSHLYREWPLFQCNPGDWSSTIVRIKENIAKLEVLDDPTIWSICDASSTVKSQGSLSESRWALQPIDPFIRDSMLAITEHMWRLSKKRILSSWESGRQNAEAFPWMDRIILLPQMDALHSLLIKYICQDNEQFHLFAQQRALTSEHLLPQTDNKIVVGILFLLKIAQVIRSASSPQARDVCDGFIEVCSSLVDDAIYEKAEVTGTAASIEVSLDLLQLLHWSGDPWHMTVVLGTACKGRWSYLDSVT